MTIDEIIECVGALDGVLILRPAPGDGSPEISWGDAFFYHSPDGTVPTAAQPFATIVTKDYPGEASSRLDRPDAFRVNIAAGREEFVRRTGRTPQDPAAGEEDQGVDDTVTAHPVHGSAGWLAVVNPGPRTDDSVRELLRHAHGLARARHERRRGR
ncbi:DUF6194 family protein [Streptomyces sp. NPDC051704]|uniref:DUF6194 family protein n=1 Tax=Streptomyces sp. NPDC051704 TaxID=3365671 RepID=UPI0037A8477E